MKKIIIVLLCAVALPVLAPPLFTYGTNYPSVALTVVKPNELFVNGSPVGAAGFLYVENQILMLQTNVSALQTAQTITPTNFASGVYYPSNTYNLAAITNGMGNFGFWVGNSNGQALVSVSLSNGVARVKQLAP